ncbi:MAG TPA: VC0807 family protein [Methylibium sp.]|nr:VC0807 family protein [Methylibium sp.]
MTSAPPAKPAAKPAANPLVEILVSIVIPAVILMKFSDAAHLGSLPALGVALAFPLGWGLWEAWRHRKPSFIAALGIVSTLLTGGIGLLALDARWLAVKEAAVPALIGLAVLVSARTRWPLVKVLVYNPAVIDVPRVERALEERGNAAAFERCLGTATWLVAVTFFFSAVMNYLLARWVVTSPAGTEAFNAELGRLTLLSYPAIALPSMLMMVGVLFYLTRAVRRLTGLTLGQVLHGGEDETPAA